jgi:hypothetical protein
MPYMSGLLQAEVAALHLSHCARIGHHWQYPGSRLRAAKAGRIAGRTLDPENGVFSGNRAWHCEARNAKISSVGGARSAPDCGNITGNFRERPA